MDWVILFFLSVHQSVTTNLSCTELPRAKICGCDSSSFLPFQLITANEVVLFSKFNENNLSFITPNFLWARTMVETSELWWQYINNTRHTKFIIPTQHNLELNKSKSYMALKFVKKFMKEVLNSFGKIQIRLSDSFDTVLVINYATIWNEEVLTWIRFNVKENRKS